jgi:hypothetical protein
MIVAIILSAQKPVIGKSLFQAPEVLCFQIVTIPTVACNMVALTFGGEHFKKRGLGYRSEIINRGG